MPDLLIGCGSDWTRKIKLGDREEWSELVTLDMNGTHNPTVVHDLNHLPLPFEDNTFDEIHAYDVLEHCGKQGDWRYFFEQWSDFWRILKPDGRFAGTCPHWTSPWAWMDPGHTRVFGQEILVFLDQSEYVKQVGITPLTDYRFCYQADFELTLSELFENKQYAFVLKAIKPTRFRHAWQSATTS